MDLSLRSGERQVAYNLNDVRYDHRARYHWASGILPEASMVIDIGCGIGYGTHILASGPHVCVGLDHSAETIKFALRHWHHEDLAFQHGGVDGLAEHIDDAFDAAVCFEVVEHIADPLPMLREARRVAKTLLASVPNETVFPYKGYDFHHRHYTKAEFEALLNSAGWRVTEWWGQTGPESGVEWNCEGRTLIAVCERGEELFFSVNEALSPTKEPAPDHVVILGLGPSLEHYVDTVKRLGNRRAFSDETWGINAVGDVVNCDRIFHMDAVEIQEARAEARPQSNIAQMLKWMRAHSGPIYTSTLPKDNQYPGLVPYPLQDVINTTGFAYFNGTAAYAVAYAIYLGVKRISLYGCDYSYANSHLAEKGRGCLEFWLGIAAGRGIEIGVSEHTSLLDACEPEEAKFYGYDCVKVNLETENGLAKITFADREKLPTADEIEARYDHAQPTSPHVRKE